MLRTTTTLVATVAEIYITFRGFFPNLDVPRRVSTKKVRGPNLARSTSLVELSSPVSPETLAESTEAYQLRPKRQFEETS